MALRKPFEVSIEVNNQCNYVCEFCFAKNFPTRESPSGKQLKKVLQNLASDGIERVRFTGGEPLLRKDLPEIVSFAKQLGMVTSLNTNASLLPDAKIRQLSGCLDDALVSFHAFDEAGETKLSGKQPFFQKKLSAVKGLSGQGVFVRAATILTGKNIEQLEKFHSQVEALPVSQWVLLRLIPNPSNLAPVSVSSMAKAVEKIVEFNKERKKSERVLIENALPFCCHFPEKVKKAALGGLREDGHSTLFIDSNLSIKPSYFLDLSLGNALSDSIMAAWNSAFMRRMHSLEFIAEPCHKCRHVRGCMGGSRFAALLVNYSLYALDPLAFPEKFIL